MYVCDFHPAWRASSRCETPWMTMSFASFLRSASCIQTSPIGAVLVIVTVLSSGPWCPVFLNTDLRTVTTAVKRIGEKTAEKPLTWGYAARPGARAW